MKYILLLFFFVTINLQPTGSISSETDIDYNYEYEKNGPYTKFSDWVPNKLHKWNPVFLEDFYELYGLKLYHGENDLRKNIYFLKIALKKRFRHPKNALCFTPEEQHYHKYRLLLFMQINLMIMRSYMRIGSLYDKRHLYFYNLDFAYDLNRSFGIAETFYKEAMPYWEKAHNYARQADKIPHILDLGTIESTRFEIMEKKLDYGKIINSHLSRLDKKKKLVNEYLQKHPEENKPFLSSIE